MEMTEGLSIKIENSQQESQQNNKVDQACQFDSSIYSKKSINLSANLDT